MSGAACGGPSPLWWPPLPGTAGMSWCPPCPAALTPLPALLLLLQSRNYHGGSARGERENKSSLGHRAQLWAGLHVQTAPHVPESPWPRWAARPPVPCPALVALCPWVQVLSSSPAAPQHSRVNSPNTASSPRQCQHTAALLPGPWSGFCCSSTALQLHKEQDTLHNSC